MKPTQLQELLRLITRTVIKEYTVMTSTGTEDQTDTTNGDPSTTPTDTMTPAEKAKQNLDAQKTRLQKIRTADMNLKGTKTQSDYFNQQLKQNKLKVTAQEKELQNLKAGKSISSGGAGSVSATQ